MREHGSAVYNVFLLTLSVYVLITIFLGMFYISNPEVKLVLQYVDLTVCLIFLTDFFVNFYLAEKKLIYMKWGWIDFLSSIPMLDPLRWGRLARVIRIIRFLRTIKSLKVLITSIQKSKFESLSLIVFVVTFFTYTICASLILEFESQSGGEINTASEALWWAFLNIMNAKVAVTQAISEEGVIITVILNKIGLLLFAYFNAIIIGWLLQKRTEQLGA